MVLNVSHKTSKELYILLFSESRTFFFFFGKMISLYMLKLYPMHLVLLSLTPRKLALHGLKGYCWQIQRCSLEVLSEYMGKYDGWSTV